MRIGIFSFAAAQWETLLALWRDAEALRFDTAWLGDDLITPGLSDFESWTLLAALARETRRIRLGVLVSSVAFRHPTFLAAQALTLDHVSGGRVSVGVGSGAEINDYGLLGERPPPRSERIRALEEQLEVLGPLLRGEPVRFEGLRYRATVPAMPAPLQRPRPPLIVAASGERTLRLVARFGDGWASAGGQSQVGPPVPLAAAAATTRRLAERLDGLCREAGRDPGSIARIVVVFRSERDPFASVDAFDELAGAYADAGIDELALPWPPLALIRAGRSPTAMERRRFERIAAERIAGR